MESQQVVESNRIDLVAAAQGGEKEVALSLSEKLSHLISQIPAVGIIFALLSVFSQSAESFIVKKITVHPIEIVGIR